MKPTLIWPELVNTLKNYSDLSYIKQVFEGKRFNIEPDSLPCIMLEPTQNGEAEPGRHTMNVKNVYFNVNVFAFSSANYSEFEKTIVGGVDYKGILDIENDIRACLQRSYTLGDNVIDIRFEPTIFDDQVEFESKYPVRGMLMPIRILYQQVNDE